MNAKNLVEALNEYNFCAFPRKDDPKKLSLSATVEGTRYFITRRSVGTDGEGKAKYGWTLGNAWKKQN